MRSILFISNFKFRFLLLLLFPLVTIIYVDHWLFDNFNFLEKNGYGTQEGQIIEKIELAKALINEADVILLGSSNVRTNIASKPFLRRGLIPLNLGVSGGGPVYELSILNKIRSWIPSNKKPTIILELNSDAFDLTSANAWGELEHLIYTNRSRFYQLSNFFNLWSMFKEYNLSSLFLTTSIFPSHIYKTYNKHLMSLRWPDLKNLALYGYKRSRFFYGSEDLFGYSPSNSFYKGKLPFRANDGCINSQVSKQKVRHFLNAYQLAKQITPNVAILQASRDRLLEKDRCVVQSILSQLPSDKHFIDVDFINFEEKHFDVGIGGHLNRMGAEHFANKIIDQVINTDKSSISISDISFIKSEQVNYDEESYEYIFNTEQNRIYIFEVAHFDKDPRLLWFNSLTDYSPFYTEHFLEASPSDTVHTIYYARYYSKKNDKVSMTIRDLNGSLSKSKNHNHKTIIQSIRSIPYEPFTDFSDKY